MRTPIVIFLISVLTSVAYAKDTRIIGGDYTEISNFPYMASLRYWPPNLTFCGGAILSHTHILTAAHCLFQDERRYHLIRIYTGITNTHSTSGPTHEIARVFFYPEYTGSGSLQEMNAHDIAVVKIKGRIEFNQFQNKIELPDRDIRHNDQATLSGWGMETFPNEMPPIQLKTVGMTIFHNAFCTRFLPRNLHKDQFCAFNEHGIGPCSGDSGSPLICQGKVVGVVSFNIPCAQGIPDIYTKVYSYLDFIRNALNQ